MRFLPGTLLLAAVLALGSCKPDRRAEGRDGSSTLTIKGSDTLVMLAQRLAESFMEKNPGVAVQVTGGGTGTGIAALINGTTEIATASRPMKVSEKAKVQERRGKPAVEHAVALDGIAIYVHESNPIPHLTLEQIKKIYEGRIKDWSEVGGQPSPITLYSRENNSGTYAYFKEEVLDDEDFDPRAQTLPGTAAVVNAIARDPRGIGFGGIAYGGGVRALPVKKDESSEAVAPSMETVTDGTYPIARKLFMYTVGEPTGLAARYLEFAKSPEGQRLAEKAGYYPLGATTP
jgi:phosphate transport system substrate-binding protein